MKIRATKITLVEGGCCVRRAAAALQPRLWIVKPPRLSYLALKGGI